MTSFQQWREERIDEIAVAVNPEAIIAGLPTLDSVVEQIFGHSRVPPYVPSMFKSVGNDDQFEIDDEFDFDPEEEQDDTAPSANNGGLVKNQQEEDDSFCEPSSPLPELKIGLGELGMKKISDTTFGKSNISHAGESPTISQGIPVGAFQNAFESFDNYRKKLETWKAVK